MFGSGRRQQSGVSKPLRGLQIGFPRFTEDFVSPSSTEGGRQCEFHVSRSSDFFGAIEGEESDLPALPFMALGNPAARGKNCKAVVNLAKGRAASKVFSLTDGEGDVSPIPDEDLMSTTESERSYVNRVAQVKALAMRKEKMEGSGSRDLSSLDPHKFLLMNSTETDYCLGGTTRRGEASILSHDTHSYMESPRQTSEELYPPKSGSSTRFSVQSWRKGKKAAPLVDFAKCAFSCAGNMRSFRTVEALPRQPGSPESQAKDEYEDSLYSECKSWNGESRSSSGNGLKRSVQKLYSKLRAAQMTSESPRSGTNSPSGPMGEVLDAEWKRLALEQNERMTSMLDMLRGIATKLEGIASKDSTQDAQQRLYQSGKALSSCTGKQADRSASGRDMIWDQKEASLNPSDKHGKSGRIRPRQTGPSLLILDSCAKGARAFLRSFAELLRKETNDVTQRNLLFGELLPHVQFVKPWHLRYGLEAFVCGLFFANFQKAGFGMLEGLPEEMMLNAEEYWVQYQLLGAMEPRDATDRDNVNYDAGFHAFCEVNLQVIQERVHWIREWSNELLDAFLNSAKAVWRLHMLAFSFATPAQLILAAPAQAFNSEEMEPVDDADGLIMDAKAFSSDVELTVMPGFRIPEGGIIKCIVYFKPKSARTDKRRNL